ncbi:alkaline phosphatase family protein, partial [Pantoea sp. CTOTU46764]|uniref:alkaline phosphatase family protein n=1 Tax=Pantoea sp. CTOTU46764 TaxID=2953854 RepID=UPI00289F9FD5
PDRPIQYGHFYWDDGYPDSHLFEDAESLRLRHDPDFLLIHPMNIDDAGHKHSLSSPQYRNRARMADGYLSQWMPDWLAAGYQVIVTADHGMNDDRSHGGILPEETQVPLFVFGKGFSLQPDLQPQQTELCGIVCTLLGVEHDKPLCRALLAEPQ